MDALLRQVASTDKEGDKEALITALETIAKIAWSDDEVDFHHRSEESTRQPNSYSC